MSVKIPILLAVIAGGFVLATQASGEEMKAENTGTPLSPFANAIGEAEGFFTAGTRPNRNNNPGDFILAPPASNYTDKSDGTYAIFDNVQDGWQALEDQLDLIRRGKSVNYQTSMTFEQMAQKYSPDGWQNWAKNVAGFFGVQPTEQIGAYL